MITISSVDWRILNADGQNNWLVSECADEFSNLIPLGTKAAKTAKSAKGVIYKTFSPGVNTARDSVVYGFESDSVEGTVARFCDDYNAEVDRYIRKGRPKAIDDFVDYTKVKWSSTLKLHLQRATPVEVEPSSIREALYRPFNKRYLYYDDTLVDRPGLFRSILPDALQEGENTVMCIT